MTIKKYYVWYYESWDTPKKLAIFRNTEDFLDFVQITCNNRNYEIHDVEIEEADDVEDGNEVFDSFSEIFGEKMKKSYEDTLKDLSHYVHKKFFDKETEYLKTDNKDLQAESAGIWAAYEKIEKILKAERTKRKC